MWVSLFLSLSLYTHIHTDTHTYIHVHINEPFESELGTSSPFITKYFNVYFLKIRLFPYMNRPVIKSRKLNIDTILLPNAHYMFNFSAWLPNVFYNYISLV